MSWTNLEEYGVKLENRLLLLKLPEGFQKLENNMFLTNILFSSKNQSLKKIVVSSNHAQ